MTHSKDIMQWEVYKNMCRALQNYVNKAIEEMKIEKASIPMMNDYIEEMGTGGAAVCQNCEKYQDCFSEDD